MIDTTTQEEALREINRLESERETGLRMQRIDKEVKAYLRKQHLKGLSP